jgi:crotonobetainyl-CoA:carnitine CoA-transferase CaiB-like acyl-CoA transferase
LTKTTDEWLKLLEEADIPSMKCNTILDVIHDPHLRGTGFIHEREHPAIGKYVAMEHPVNFEGTPASIRIEPPTLGQHTREVLMELGYSAEEADRIATEAPKRNANESGGRKI